MKALITILGFLLIANSTGVFAQEYDDLKILYADANYKKLVKEATKYTEADKTKKDILPYFWAAKAYYQIWLSGDPDPEYKNALKDAITFLGKGISYDNKYNDGSTITEESEFISEFQLAIFDLIDNELSGGAYKKAYAWAVKYQKVALNGTGVKYVLGACKFYDQDKSTARTLWSEAGKELEGIEGIDDWTEADKKMLKVGILYSAQALKESRQESSARELLGKVAQWFENDSDWKERYDAIVN